MKQVLLLGLILTLFAVAATAQQTRGGHLRQRNIQSFRQGELTRPELRRVHRDEIRYKLAVQRARRDGIVTSAERRQLQKLRRYQRQELYRFRHDRNRRLI